METVRAEAWLYGLLTGDTALAALVDSRVYSGAAPQGATLPCVIINHQSGRDVLGVGTVRVMSRLAYLVKAVGRCQSYLALEPIADRIDAVLHGASGAVAGIEGAGAELLACTRTMTVAYAEMDEGVQYRHLGGLYQIVATNRGPLPPEEPVEPEEPGPEEP